MTIAPHRKDVDTSRVFELRQRLDLDRLDYEREVSRLVPLIGQSGVARALHLAQPSVRETAMKAEKLPPVKPGFAGGTPYEIAQRFAVGEIDREQVIDQLARWEYAPQARTDGYDSLLVDPPGTFDEVSKALSDGLLDDETYDAILDRQEELGL